jgi:hypothetical protein
VSELEVFIVTDPVQDYEETLVIVGVYSSFEEIRDNIVEIRQKSDRWDPRWNDHLRDTEVQHWVGAKLVGSWTYHSGVWTHDGAGS